MSASLEWALVDGRRMSASSMVGVPPRDRPRGVCPCCSDPITWKAGDVVVPHVAHAPGSACAATNPETAEHFNAKMRLADLVVPHGALSLSASCASCSRTVIAPWEVEVWTSAQVERAVGTRRHDVVLFDEAGAVCAAIEVLRSHRVDAAKEKDLAALGVRWIEVLAEHALAWDGEAPLWVVSADDSTRRLLASSCPHCAENRRRRAAWEDWRRAAEAERAAREAARVIAEEAERARDARIARAQQEHRRRYRQRELDVEKIRRNPPPLRIAVAVAMDGNPGAATVAAVKVAPSSPVRTCAIDGEVTNGTAVWLALLSAIERLEQVAPGAPAVFYTNHAGIADAANRVRLSALLVAEDEDNEEELLKVRVTEALARSGSIVEMARATDGRMRAPIAAIARAKSAAKEAMEAAS